MMMFVAGAVDVRVGRTGREGLAGEDDAAAFA